MRFLKFCAVVLLLLMTVSVLAGCNKTPVETMGATDPEVTTAEDEVVEMTEPTVAMSELKMTYLSVMLPEQDLDDIIFDSVTDGNSVMEIFSLKQDTGAVELFRVFYGAYYFAKDSKGTPITDQTYYVWQGNGIIPESNREFGPDGKMLDGIIERDGNFYYYNMGRPEMAGLIYVDGYYYFAKNADGLLVTNQTYYVWKTNGYCIEGNYTFDKQGRIVL